MKKFIMILSFSCLFITCILLIGFFLSKSPSFMHIYHLVFPCESNNMSVLHEKIFVHKKGYKNKFSIHFKQVEKYDISLYIENSGLPATYIFSGLIKVSFYNGTNLVYTRSLSSGNRFTYTDKNMKFIKSIVLDTIKVPFDQDCNSNLEYEVVIEIIENDLKLLEFDRVYLDILLSSEI